MKEMSSSEQKLWYLRRLNLFAAMTSTEVDEIAGRLRERFCQRGEMILDPLSSSDRIYLVKSGVVRIYQLSPEGRELTTAILRPGQLFGTSALVAIGKPGVFAEALEDAFVCVSSADVFLRIMADHPLLATKVMVALARQILHLEQQLEQLAFQDVAARLAQVLLQLAEDNGGQLPSKLTHEELAKFIGATRETVTKTLSRFAERGLIEVGYRRLTILDFEALRDEVGLEGITERDR